MSDLPGPMQPTKTTTIPGGLYAEVFLPAGTPKGVVLITHGYAEHCGRYREVAHVIVKAGWAALSYDVRGHGQSPGVRGFIDKFDAYLEDRPAAWIDDAFNDACHAWASERAAPTLLVETTPEEGLIQRHADLLLAWASSNV
jgi:alpha-beta hydrolase superfamily lysophospholipase